MNIFITLMIDSNKNNNNNNGNIENIENTVIIIVSIVCYYNRHDNLTKIRREA